jgi:predicted TIM-barrel fold metal-dependent hydrolase
MSKLGAIGPGEDVTGSSGMWVSPRTLLGTERQRQFSLESAAFLSSLCSCLISFIFRPFVELPLPPTLNPVEIFRERSYISPLLHSSLRVPQIPSFRSSYPFTFLLLPNVCGNIIVSNRMAMSFSLPLITLEEHFLSPTVKEHYVTTQTRSPYHMFPKALTDNLSDLGESRIKNMDAGSVTMQIISHGPNSLALDIATCSKANDELARAVKDHPGRYAGFATLPMADPPAAAKELRRCVKELGFVGTLIDDNCQGRFYDDEFFWPVFEAAQELDVAIYLHPSYNQGAKKVLFEGNYPDAIAENLALHGFGWHSECALHVLRLFAAKVFDHYPRLKIIIGHMGEMLPFQLDRVVRISSTQWPKLGVKPERQLRQVWDENIWVTTSGMFALAPMACLVRQCKPDRILYSVDYPFANIKWGLDFMNELEKSGMVSQEMLENIAYKNAEKLLGVKVR